MSSSRQEKRRLDYKEPLFTITDVNLSFNLDFEKTIVTAESKVLRKTSDKSLPLTLDGDDLILLDVLVNGNKCDYEDLKTSLVIKNVPDEFTLTVKTQINPKANSKLMGLYVSDGKFCTQNEPEGFRRITYFLDHPDVLARYTTTIIAPKNAYPFMLSNGNCISDKVEGENRVVVWQDPFPKPSYLFALVAGDFDELNDTFTTKSGKKVKVKLFVDKGKRDQGEVALASILKAMKWDETRFDLEYDLEIFMVVAVDFFNAGAMENKGLNIFNTKYVLANPKCATDVDLENVLSVIGHEYFHNWTGDRVTCRDWFQLSLKEGLTVFRDQEFSSDLGCRPIERIKAVKVIRGPQFAEDAGPMAHPIRPDFVMEMNNFYSLTVYEKGAEVIRMIHTILGETNFQKGMKLYFKRHDGGAVTCEDFVSAMEDASGIDLKQFRNWYSQSGTPKVTIRKSYDKENKKLTLSLKQETPATPNQEHKEPFVIPVSMGLYTKDGAEISLKRDGKNINKVVLLTQNEETWTFDDVNEDPVIALFENFSAPVKYDYPYTNEELATLLKFAKDSFVRFDVTQNLINNFIIENVENIKNGKELTAPQAIINAFSYILDAKDMDKRFKAYLLTLPTVSTLMGLFDKIDLDALIKASKHLGDEIARSLSAKFKSTYEEQYKVMFDRLKANRPYECTEEQIGDRSLAQVSLEYYANYLKLNNELDKASELVITHSETSDNFTDKLNAMRIAVNLDLPAKLKLLAAFEVEWASNSLVFDNYFRVVGGAPLKSSLDNVKALMHHECFDINNPNRVRALIGAFASLNTEGFHAIDGSGYRFLTDILKELNSKNPHVAANLITPMLILKRLDDKRFEMIKACFNELLAMDNLCSALYEKITKALK